MQIKKISFDLNILPVFRSILEKIKTNQQKKQSELILKIYEKYPDNNGSVGIDIYEEDRAELSKQLEYFYKSSLRSELLQDISSLEKLINSDEWQVFLKYAGKIDFDMSGCSSFTEKMAFLCAKENAVNLILSLPQNLINFYKQGVSNNDD